MPTTIKPGYVRPEPKDKDDDGIMKNIINDRTKAAFNASLIIPGQTKRIAKYRKAYKDYLISMGITPPPSLDDEDLSKFYVDGAFTFEPGPARKAPGPFEYMQPDDVMNYGNFLLKEFNNPTVKYRGDLGAYKRDMGLGGDGQGITSQYPYPYPYQTASVPGTDTPVDSVTGLPIDPIRFANSQPSAHDFTGIYGQRTIPVKDGGRIGYAGGGIGSRNRMSELMFKLAKGTIT